MSNYIDSINQAATASSTAAKKSATASKDEVMGKEDFLNLLVAQLKNQDPLNPDDPTEFTAQLAQFSSLEQLNNLNDSMDTLVTSNTNSDKLSTLNTIGKEAVYQDGSFNFTGEPVTLGYKLDGQAKAVTLSLQLNGATVATLKGTDLTAGNHFLTWDGLATNGQAAAHGKYKIVIEAKASEGESVAANPLIRSEVTGVDLDGEFGGVLITKAGKVEFNTIIGVYEKSSSASDSSGSSAVAKAAAAASQFSADTQDAARLLAPTGSEPEGVAVTLTPEEIALLKMI
ncbi:MAG: flagellar hook assembly protein FlgD [Desulfoprunum sp.]|nr:flagellar hook assembly protein FlgD [Desulfoprunum sp.]